MLHSLEYSSLCSLHYSIFEGTQTGRYVTDTREWAPIKWPAPISLKYAFFVDFQITFRNLGKQIQYLVKKSI